MQQREIKLQFPSDILLTLNQSEDELVDTIRTSFAIRLYQHKKLTIGKAAQIADLSRYEFENLLADNGIPISNLSISDVMADSIKIK